MAGYTDGEITVQMLWDIEQIKQLKARYFRMIDTKDWEGFRELFTDDCVHHLPQESPKGTRRQRRVPRRHAPAT